MINLDNRTFRCSTSTAPDILDDETTFEYHQRRNIIWGTYQGSNIIHGTFLARMEQDGSLSMTYQHISQDGEFMTRVCRSVPEKLPNGRIRLNENWQWMLGEDATGQSVLEEVF